MTRQQRLTKMLTDALQPTRLEVIDDSHHHAGHAGARPEGETHYRLIIQAPTLAGLSKVEQQRRIYAVIDAEWRTGLHALAIQVLPE